MLPDRPEFRPTRAAAAVTLFMAVVGLVLGAILGYFIGLWIVGN